MGYSAAKVSTHLELEKNRGYWRAKGFDRDSCQLSLSRGEEKIERSRGDLPPRLDTTLS